MMRPQFDEADLALIEVNHANEPLVQKLVEEIRIYQDLLQDSKFSNSELESEITHLRASGE